MFQFWMVESLTGDRVFYPRLATPPSHTRTCPRPSHVRTGAAWHARRLGPIARGIPRHQRRRASPGLVQRTVTGVRMSKKLVCMNEFTVITHACLQATEPAATKLQLQTKRARAKDMSPAIAHNASIAKLLQYLHEQIDNVVLRRFKV